MAGRAGVGSVEVGGGCGGGGGSGVPVGGMGAGRWGVGETSGEGREDGWGAREPLERHEGGREEVRRAGGGGERRADPQTETDRQRATMVAQGARLADLRNGSVTATRLADTLPTTQLGETEHERALYFLQKRPTPQKRPTSATTQPGETEHESTTSVAQALMQLAGGIRGGAEARGSGMPKEPYITHKKTSIPLKKRPTDAFAALSSEWGAGCKEGQGREGGCGRRRRRGKSGRARWW